MLRKLPIAFPTTVQINNNVVGGSSGVSLLERAILTVLTANHVVKRPDLTYTIHTPPGRVSSQQGAIAAK